MGQTDKGGNPYILHPLRIMCAVEKDLRSGSGKYREDYLCAAICHDVIEDYNRREIILKKRYWKKFILSWMEEQLVRYIP